MAQIHSSSNRPVVSLEDKLINMMKASLEGGEDKFALGSGGLVQGVFSMGSSGSNFNTTFLGFETSDTAREILQGKHNTLFEELRKKGLSPGRFPSFRRQNGLIDFLLETEHETYKAGVSPVIANEEEYKNHYSFANKLFWRLLHNYDLDMSNHITPYTCDLQIPSEEEKKSSYRLQKRLAYTINNLIKKYSDEENHSFTHDFHLSQVNQYVNNAIKASFLHIPPGNIHFLEEYFEDPFIESCFFDYFRALLHNDCNWHHTSNQAKETGRLMEYFFPQLEILDEDDFTLVKKGSSVITALGHRQIGTPLTTIDEAMKNDRQLSHQSKHGETIDNIFQDKRAGKWLFGGLERCDYTKGLIERGEIFTYALEYIRARKPAEKEEARLYQITEPTRPSIKEYPLYHKNLCDKVEELNEMHASPENTEPIVHMDEGIRPPHNFYFMYHMDVMMVTSLADGYNIVAPEYINVQGYKDYDERGILALGNCGFAEILKERGFGLEDGVVYVDPLRPEESGKMIATALENRFRITNELVDFVRQNCDTAGWMPHMVNATKEINKEYITPYKNELIGQLAHGP